VDARCANEEEYAFPGTAGVEHLYDCLKFLAKAATVVVAIIAVIVAATSLGLRRASSEGGHIGAQVQRPTGRHEPSAAPGLSRGAGVQEVDQAGRGARKKAAKEKTTTGACVLDFDGDLHASKVDHLRHEITAVLTSAREQDEVLVRIEPGAWCMGTDWLLRSWSAYDRTKSDS
jgi:serine protease SohB